MNLLQQRFTQNLCDREKRRKEVRARLQSALTELAPGERVYLYGSITRPQNFTRRSDVDLVFLEEPRRFSRYRLQVMLEEAIGCPVDLSILNETRLRMKIQQDGELWIG